MGFHTFDPEGADRLDDPARYAYLSAEELIALFGPTADGAVADLGSGTGFYTDDVAAVAGRVYAVDVQPEMHDRYRERGLPDGVEPITAAIADLPFDDGRLDGAFSTMTYHEFATPAALDEVARVLAPGGRLGIGDWTATGPGREGPPVDERYDAAAARGHLERAGFVVERCEDRRETFVASARRPRE